MKSFRFNVFQKCFAIKVFTLVAFLYTVDLGKSHAQQSPIFTNYLANPLSFNPAYAGSKGALSFLLLHRSQWTGFKGAPETNTAVVHTPIPKYNLGAGLSFIQDKTGPLSRSGVFMDWAYQLNLSSKGTLSFGLKTGVNTYSANFNSLYANDQEDLFLDQQIEDHVLFNLGTGVYYSHDKYFLSLSMPKILNNNISDEEMNGHGLCNETRTTFLSGGYLYQIHPGLIIKPTTLIRFVSGAPLSIDAGVNLIFFEKLSAGVFGRYEDSFGLMFHYWFNDQLRVGYSYDYNASALTEHNYGSHEILISYDLIYKNSKVKSPRYF